MSVFWLLFMVLPLGFVLWFCLRTPNWCDEDFDHEEELRLRGWDK